LPPTERKASGGFSLVELLVSMAVLTLIVGLLAQMLNQATTIWNQGEGNKERMQDLRALADFMGNELQAALLPVNRTSKDNLEFVVNPTDVADKFKNRDCVFWQTPLASNQDLGDVAEVGYFVKWDDTNAANPRPVLCRFFVNPGNLDSAGTAVPDPHFLIYASPNKWVTDTEIEAVAPGDNKEENNYKGLFAENVIGMWIDCLDKDGMSLSPSGQKWSSRDTTPCTLPVAIDLGLVMIDSRSAKRLNSTLQQTIQSLYAKSTSAKAFVDFALETPSLRPISPGLRYYQTRIYLQNSR